MEKIKQGGSITMDIVLKIDHPVKGSIFTEEIEGKVVIFQIVEVKEGRSMKTSTSPKMTREQLLQALKSGENPLKGSIIKDEDPFASPIPQSEWEHD